MSEYEQLKARGFKEYSEMHRQMYEVVVSLFKNKPTSIYEIGFGIGWGLERLLEENCIERYVGCEPDRKSFDYVFDRVKDERVALYPAQFMRSNDVYRYVLCIEVIEHLECNLTKLYKMFAEVRKMAGTFILSTPDKNTDEHGIYTKHEVKECLHRAEFNNVVMIEHQIPHTLFIAQ